MDLKVRRHLLQNDSHHTLCDAIGGLDLCIRRTQGSEMRRCTKIEENRRTRPPMCHMHNHAPFVMS